MNLRIIPALACLTSIALPLRMEFLGHIIVWGDEMSQLAPSYLARNAFLFVGSVLFHFTHLTARLGHTYLRPRRRDRKTRQSIASVSCAHALVGWACTAIQVLTSTLSVTTQFFPERPHVSSLFL